MSTGGFSRCLLALAAMVSHLVQADDHSLRHDPFARPALAALTAGTTPSAVAEAPPPPWSPRLTAVMIAGRDSLVTVDGVIVRLGAEIDGHKLVQVRDREAVFQRGRKRIVLEIRETVRKQGKDRGSQ